MHANKAKFSYIRKSTPIRAQFSEMGNKRGRIRNSGGTPFEGEKASPSKNVESAWSTAATRYMAAQGWMAHAHPPLVQQREAAPYLAASLETLGEDQHKASVEPQEADLQTVERGKADTEDMRES